MGTYLSSSFEILLEGVKGHKKTFSSLCISIDEFAPLRINLLLEFFELSEPVVNILVFSYTSRQVDKLSVREPVVNTVEFHQR